MAQDFEVDIMPGLHCWNFADRRPLTINVIEPFRGGLGWDKIPGSFREFLSCDTPKRDYPGLYKFITEQYILRCESRRVHFVPRAVPADDFACELLIREKFFWACEETNNQQPVADTVLDSSFYSRRYEVALHSLEVKGFYMSGSELRAEIGYSIVVRPARPLPTRLDELKNAIYNPQEIRDLFACCALHFEEPGSIRFFKDVMYGAAYIDPTKAPAVEEERVFRMLKNRYADCNDKKAFLKTEETINRIKLDPLSYVDDEDELVANLARALVS